MNPEASDGFEAATQGQQQQKSQTGETFHLGHIRLVYGVVGCLLVRLQGNGRLKCLRDVVPVYSDAGNLPAHQPPFNTE